MEYNLHQYKPSSHLQVFYAAHLHCDTWHTKGTFSLF